MQAIAITGGVVGIVVFIICLVLMMLMLASRSRTNAFAVIQNEVKEPGFSMTRKEIVDYVQSLDPENISAKIPEGPQHLYSLKWKRATFAMLHGTDKGVLMVVLLDEKTQNELSKKHNVQKSKFPRGEHWFTIPIDTTFTDNEQVFKIIQTAIEFVKVKKAAKPASVA